MNNYIIEGNINFYEELYKSIDNIVDDSLEGEENNTCLISGEKLIEHFVKLKCGHSFNYLPLYNDIVNHKKKFNFKESGKSFLSKNQIRCPYCRSVQDGLLPFYPLKNVKQMYGVTENDFEKDHSYYCEYKTINELFNKDLPEDKIHNNPYISCSNFHNNKVFEQDYITKCDKYYCIKHCNVLLKQKIKEEKEKIKAEKEKAKMELKKIVLEAKMEMKKKVLESKMKNVSDENIVLSHENIKGGCQEILKTGLKKGTICGLQLFSICQCKRHFNLKNKKNAISVDVVSQENKEN